MKHGFVAATIAIVLLGGSGGLEQEGVGGDWTYYHGDQGATRFSTLTQINTGNVKSLKRAWTFHTGDDSGFFESTPIVVDSVMYFSARTGVFALDAVTGTQIWKYEKAGTARRGPSYWPGGQDVAPRIFSSTEIFQQGTPL